MLLIQPYIAALLLLLDNIDVPGKLTTGAFNVFLLVCPTFIHIGYGHYFNLFNPIKCS